MGWRGALRSFAAAARAAEREAQRIQKAELKAAIAEDSAAAVTAWEEFLDRLVSIHTNLAEAIDWRSMATAPPPTAPTLSDENEQIARQALQAFQPRFTDIFQGGSKNIRRKLEQALAAAPDKDLVEFSKAKAAYSEALNEWKADSDLARQLLDGDTSAMKSVLEEAKASILGDGFAHEISYHMEGKNLHAKPLVHGVDIVPGFRRKQLASGRLSETKMPVGELNERYQDYVASVALKVGGDLFQILPVDEAYVTCETSMVNQQTGHKENTPILSVHFVRETFRGLRLGDLDPSDAMRNFRHVMTFKRTHGFSRIEPLAPI